MDEKKKHRNEIYIFSFQITDSKLLLQKKLEFTLPFHHALSLQISN